MIVTDVFNEGYEIERGMGVRWTEEYGLCTGIILRVEDKTMCVLSNEGDYVYLAPEAATLSADLITQRIREMDEEERTEFLELRASTWEETHGSSMGGVLVGRKGRRGRARTAGKIAEVMAVFVAAEWLLKKQEIIGQAGVTDAEYIHAIRNLLNSNQVVQTGKRRGAMYGLMGREYGPRPPEPFDVCEDVKDAPDIDIDELIEFLGEPRSRKEITGQFGFDNNVWIDVACYLRGCSNVNVTGQKRGTRYQKVEL